MWYEGEKSHCEYQHADREKKQADHDVTWPEAQIVSLLSER